ncbi:MAG: hypothetical protein HY821_14855 [Acidobacteria bacterium]|nr:hypothetical protein [Acidobacteriota bacterium]
MLLQDPRFILGAVVSAALLAALVIIVYQRRLTPVEKERRRRVFLNRERRTVEGLITEANSYLIHYQYELSGVIYSASQDVSALRGLLPADPARLIGAASVKYDPRNPANSMVLCEEWSGLPLKKELTDANHS